VLTRRVLDDVGVDSVVDLDLTIVAAGLASLVDETVLDEDFGFRILTGWAENVLPNEAIQQILQLASFVRAVDNEAVVFEIKLGLCAELATKVLGWICNNIL
jgi:hypothetical protein